MYKYKQYTYILLTFSYITDILIYLYKYLKKKIYFYDITFSSQQIKALGKLLYGTKKKTWPMMEL